MKPTPPLPPQVRALTRISAGAHSSSPSPEPPQVTATKLLNSYFKDGLLDHARHLFDQMPHRGVVTWTSMISGFSNNGRHSEAWDVFREMLREGVQPNSFTASSTLSACRGSGDLQCGKVVHGVAVKLGLVGQPYVDNLLIDMYANCAWKNMKDARAVFEEIDDKTDVAWTMMVTGYTRAGDGSAAVRLFLRMMREDVKVSPFSCSSAVRACATAGSLSFGKQMHCVVVKSMFDWNVPVANSLLDMYCRCMSSAEAKQWFREMPEKDLISWNTVVGGLSRCSPSEALELLPYMFVENVRPNEFTFCSIVSACTNLGVLKCGQQVHGTAIRRGYGGNLPLSNALIDMYSRCGNVKDSRGVFDAMQHKDLVSWTSMMNGYGIHGYAKEAIELFDTMAVMRQPIDHIVFVGVLSACSHAGLVDKGLDYFHRMLRDYGIYPTQEIYGCVIDLLSRAGRVEEAYDLIRKMPFEPDESIWGALLGACRIYKNLALGKLAANKILSLKPDVPKTYVMLSNIYAADGEWDEFAKMRRMVRGTGNCKEVGRSWIEVGEAVHSFSVEDRCSSLSQMVYETLEVLLQHMADENMC